MPRLSIVIPTLRRHSLVRRALDRLEDQRVPPGSFEVVLAVDAQEEDPAGVEAATESRPYPVRMVRGGRPGAAAARNHGWQAAEAPLVLFLDDDILAGPELVGQHLEWHERHPENEVGVLGHVRWARELRVTPFMRWLERGVQFDYTAIEGQDAGWGRFYTANASVKRRLVERAGGFDEERLPFGYEDLDLAARMSRLGFRLLYNRRALAEHLHPMDLDFWRRRVARIAVSERRFVRLHPEISPYFHHMFEHAAAAPPARGRAARLAPVVPPWVPWLGRRVWESVDARFRQELAPHFLAAWAGWDERGGSSQPDLSEREASSSGGSEPSGPK